MLFYCKHLAIHLLLDIASKIGTGKKRKEGCQTAKEPKIIIDGKFAISNMSREHIADYCKRML